MKMFVTRKLMLLSSFAVILTALALLFSLASSKAQPQGATKATTSVLAQVSYQASYDSWSYKAGKDEQGRFTAIVMYDRDSMAGIKAYSSNNRQLAIQVAQTKGQAEVEITFRNYVSPEQFRSWVKSYNFKPTVSMLRMVEADGKRITTWINPQNEDALPQSIIDDKLASWADTGAVIRGVAVTTGIIDSSTVAKLLTDPQVYLVDVTPNIVRNDLSDNGVAEAQQTSVQVADPFWKMEDFGLENFR